MKVNAGFGTISLIKTTPRFQVFILKSFDIES